MKTVITIFTLCFTMTAICQIEDKMQGNVKLITESSFEIFTTWNGKDTLYPSSYKYEFNYAKNNLLITKMEYYKGKLSQKIVYSYNNKLDSISNYGSNNVLNFTIIYTYNKNGFLKLKRKVYGHSITDQNYETYYFYNEKNELIETKAFIEINGSRVVGQSFAYDEELGFEYSPDRFVVSKITTNTKGQIVRIDGESIFETYTYDKYGNELNYYKETNYDGEKSITSIKNIYKYDSKGNWIEKKKVSNYFGDITTIVYNRTIEYYSK